MEEGWQIEYYSDDVALEILNLPKGLKVKYAQETMMLKKLGPWLRMPYARYLGNELYELRLKAKEGIARVFYIEQDGKIIVMLHSFVKKTQKIPMNILETARARQKIYNQYGRQ